MSDWSHGYNTSLGYLYQYYRETAPSWMNWAIMIKGFKAPAANRFRYLELGCGQGFGLNLLASMYPESEFVGVDFNPQHIAHARDLALASGLKNVRFEEADFMNLSRDWPYGQFQFAVLHGIYSWISESLRAAVCVCLEKALVSGGLAYCSYNSLPGWLSAMPLQRLLRRHQVAKGLAPVPAIEKGFAFMDRLRQSNAALFTSLPQLAGRMEGSQKQDRSYLVQEYLHENWHPLWFSDVCQEMDQAKLSFIGSATLPENYLPGMLPENMRGVIQEQDDPTFAQELIDCVVNQSFRRDVFQRGMYRPWPANMNHDLLSARFTLIKKPDNYLFKTSFGEVSGNTDIYDPIVAALETGPKRVTDLGQPGQAIQSLTLLMHHGAVGWEVERPDTKPSIRFNKAVAKAVCQGAPYSHLACPRIGNGLSTDTTTLLMLDALADKTPAKPEAVGQALLTRLQGLGRSLAKDGQPVTDPEQAKAEALRLAQVFLDTTLPMYKSLGAWE